ncbi:MAG: exodeoxyribonuclease VII large subunit [Solirubrobacterales bacterium]
MASDQPSLHGIAAGTPEPVRSGPKEPEHPGPFPVGRYANELRGFLRKRSRVRLLGEVTGLRITGKSVYFELRDGEGAIPCAIWRSDFDRMRLPTDAFADGVEVVVAGGLDYYPGSATASPSFSFRATHLRLAGEGDLLAQLAALRRRLADDGLFEPQKRLHIPALPRAIGVVTGRDSAAKADIRAGLERRGWRGLVIFAHPPVQDRHAAPQIREALSRLAGMEEVETVIVARGGGSLADLWAFCDEGLCRMVALLRVPVISAVGHEVDRTLLDDVAAVSCSTPTHAAEAAVEVDVRRERAGLAAASSGLRRAGALALSSRVRGVRSSAQALGRHAGAERNRLRQLLREIRAAATRGGTVRRERLARFGLVLERRAGATAGELGVQRRRVARAGTAIERAGGGGIGRRRTEIKRLAATLEAHDPDRVLERGYAIVSSADEDRVVVSAERARRIARLRVRWSDDHVEVEVKR